MKKWLKIALLIIVVIVIAFISFILYLQDFQLKINDINNPPKFIEADFIDLSKVYTISKYRSGVGHSTDDSLEKCRSLRHIYGGQGEEFKNAEEKWEKLSKGPNGGETIDIYSPVNGRIVDLSSRDENYKEGFGGTIVIKPDNAKGYKVRIDSIFFDPSIKPLARLRAGQKIGVISTTAPAEILIYYSYIGGGRNVSYIAALPDKIFAEYQKRGLAKREDAIITKEYRDSHPFTCENPSEATSTILEHPEMKDLRASFVVLSGYIDKSAGKKTEDKK